MSEKKPAAGHPTLAATEEPVPLRNPMQRVIAAVLAKETKTPVESIHANTTLASLGSDSVFYLRLKHALEVTLKLRTPVPIEALLRVHSVEDLELEIVKMLASTAVKGELLTTLVSGGDKTPLFLFPPGSGGMLPWIRLMKYLPERPLHALRLRGLNPGEPIFGSLEEILDVYEKCVRSIQPSGPYAFLGYSFGGLLAFSLAARLEAQGESFAFVGNLDQPPSMQGQKAPPPKEFAIDILATRGVFTQAELPALRADLAETADADVTEELNRRYGERLQAVGMTVPVLQAWQNVMAGAKVIGDRFVASGRLSTLDVLHGEPVPHWGISEDDWTSKIHDWDAFAEDVRYHRVPGNHISMLSDEFVEGFQEVLNKALKAREGCK